MVHDASWGGQHNVSVGRGVSVLYIESMQVVIVALTASGWHITQHLSHESQPSVASHHFYTLNHLCGRCKWVKQRGFWEPSTLQIHAGYLHIYPSDLLKHKCLLSSLRSCLSPTLYIYKLYRHFNFIGGGHITWCSDVYNSQQALSASTTEKATIIHSKSRLIRGSVVKQFTTLIINYVQVKSAMVAGRYSNAALFVCFFNSHIDSL